MKLLNLVCGLIVITCWPEEGQSGRAPTECREGTGDLGIGMYVSITGNGYWVSEKFADGRVAHRFSVEPQVSQIDPKGPSAGKLRENDTIVAVDGSPITSFDGGFKLANGKIGQPLTLRVRRNKEEMEIQVIPVNGCNLPGVSVRRTQR